jgi:hypothetical protein
MQADRRSDSRSFVIHADGVGGQIGRLRDRWLVGGAFGQRRWLGVLGYTCNRVRRRLRSVSGVGEWRGGVGGCRRYLFCRLSVSNRNLERSPRIHSSCKKPYLRHSGTNENSTTTQTSPSHSLAKARHFLAADTNPNRRLPQSVHRFSDSLGTAIKQLPIFLRQPTLRPTAQALSSVLVELNPLRGLRVGGQKLWPVEVVAIGFREIFCELLDGFGFQVGAELDEGLDRVLDVRVCVNLFFCCDDTSVDRFLRYPVFADCYRVFCVW